MTEIYCTEGQLLHTDKNHEYTGTIEGLYRAMADGAILEGIAVKCSDRHTLTVEFGNFTGEMDKSEVQLTEGEPVKDIAVITRVGKPVCFKIIGIDGEKSAPKITVSRKAAQIQCAKNYLAKLIPGDIIPATVTHLEHFGAFIDIGCGIVSLLTIDSMSVSRISHPSDRLSVGSEIKVIVRSLEWGADGIPSRIFVSRRELLGTWEENAALFSVGQTVTGIVRSIEPYGIFVELTPNLAGLAEYRSDITVGQTTAVYIKNIIPERMKIKLVIIDAHRSVGTKYGQITSPTSELSHISSWRYSPDCCERIIESVFS